MSKLILGGMPLDEIKKILIATDGSEYTQSAVERGLQLAKLLDAEVTALFVVDYAPFSSIPSDSTVVLSVHAIMETEGEKAVGDVKQRGEKMNVRVNPIVTEGSPVKRILEISADHDLIVIGTLGRSAISKLFMGSVAERVTRYAQCPVLVVRARKE